MPALRRSEGPASSRRPDAAYPDVSTAQHRVPHGRALLVAWLAALGLAALLARPAAADLGGYVIRNYDTDITVQEDARLLVEERIEVDFSAPRRGIYRNIPVRYTDPRGFAYAIGFRLIEVVDEEGRSQQTKVTNEGAQVSIRIGDPDRTITGRQVYVIRYRVSGALTQSGETDELYWNAIGDEWFTTIDAATVQVHLPASVGDADIVSNAWSGRFGSTESDVSIDAADAQAIDFQVDRSLEPNESVTVRVAWPSGHVDFPSALEIWLRRLAENWVIFLPFLALFYLMRRYRAGGRDPEGPAAVTVRYEAPEGVGPGEIGTIIDEKVDLVDITATLVDLAVRGYLKIEVEEEEGFLRSREVTVYERLPDKDASGLMKHERELLDALFTSGDRVSSEDLKEKFYKHLPDIKNALYGQMTQDGLFRDDPETVRMGFYAGGFLLGFLAFFVGLAWAWWRGMLMPYAMIAPAISGVGIALLYFLFAGAMPSRGKRGVELKAWAEGFQEFVDRVESDRLERAEARNAFESLLPYAMALGVAATWAKKFEGIYEEAGPTWYVGPHMHGHISTRSMESSLSSAMAATATHMAQAPRSSGSSGGGGFSGGGFGGGGGGSW